MDKNHDISGANVVDVFPEIVSISLWAHISGIPFDMRTKEGLSLAAGLVGGLIETNDYTKNLTSLNVAHVKVEADLTKPLPLDGELIRENGDIITVSIMYVWTPPTCSHCNKIGHILKICVNAPSVVNPQETEQRPDPFASRCACSCPSKADDNPFRKREREFYRMVIVKAAFNSIRSFQLPSGQLITDVVKTSSLAVNHFESLLVPACLPVTHSPVSSFRGLLSFSYTSTQVSSFSNPPSDEEISKAILKLNPNKAPGSDDLTSGFFKGSWNIVGQEVVTAIQQFFRSGFLPASVNATILSIVPKHPGASAISDYEPISCCNTLYKSITKLM